MGRGHYNPDEATMPQQIPCVELAASKLKMDPACKTSPSSGSRVTTPPKESRVWNTKNLGLRLASDFAGGASAALLVAPIITIIDKQVSVSS